MANNLQCYSTFIAIHRKIENFFHVATNSMKFDKFFLLFFVISFPFSQMCDENIELRDKMQKMSIHASDCCFNKHPEKLFEHERNI